MIPSGAGKHETVWVGNAVSRPGTLPATQLTEAEQRLGALSHTEDQLMSMQ